MSFVLVKPLPKWLVVEMMDEGGKTVEVIPPSWFNEKTQECAWPPVKFATSLIKKYKEPETNWPVYPSRKLGDFDDYTRAREAAKQFEFTSDINSDADQTPTKRNSRPPHRLGYKNDSDEDDLESTTKRSKLTQPPPLPSGTNRKTSRKSVDSVIRRNAGSLPMEEQELLSASFGEDSFHGAKNAGNPSPVFVSQPSNPVTIVQPSTSHGNVAEITSTPQSHFQPPSSFIHRRGYHDHSERNDNEISGQLKKLVADVGIIKQYMINLDKKVDQLRTQTFAKPKQVDRLKQVPLPFKNVEDFIAFDVQVGADEVDILTEVFTLCGGDTVVEACGRVMRKLMWDEVATKYSLKGQKGNLSFSDTKIWEIMKDAMLSVQIIQPTEKKIEAAVSEWLRHANQRLKEKKSRLQKQNAA